MAAAVAVAATPPASIRAEDILDHLEQTIAWYRHMQSIEQATNDVLVRQNVRQASLKALQLAFDFARAEVALVASDAQTSPNPANSGSSNLQQAATRAADRVSGVEARIADLDAAITKASESQRRLLQAQRKQLSAELDVAQGIQSTIQTLISFSGNLGASGGVAAGLAGQIDELERSAPEARHEKRANVTANAQPPAPATSSPVAPPPVFQPASRGIIGLIADLFSIHSRRRQFMELRKETDSLVANGDRLRAPLLAEMRTSIHRTDEILNVAPAQNTSDVETTQRELTALSARIKQVSAATVPLAEQGIAAGTTRSYLQESVNDLDDDRAKAARYLLVRMVMLAGAILAILVVSEAWRRATFRYVTDSRRRRQFLMLRRIAVTGAVIVTVMIGFVTEFGSLATYAGFATAGLAVALQSPILSMVAYFFLIGRYGIRVGDRVTISGVTGDVLEIGLVRIYLMELGPNLESTGRVVVFSNAVIFQPAAALYKQMPGIDYAWRTVTLTLSGESDFKLAEAKLNAAVDSVYQQYRERIERQYRMVEKAIDVNVSAPRPESRLRFTDSGLQVIIRYPAELKDAAATDDRVMKALYDAIAGEPKLQFAPSGRPTIQLAA